MDWARAIALMANVRSAVYEIEGGRLYRYHLPRIGATNHDLQAAEDRIGQPLDDSFRTFLRYADGWPAIFHNIDLLGTTELGQGQLWNRALELLHVAVDSSVDIAYASQDLIPFALNTDDTDVFAFDVSQGRRGDGSPIAWLATGALVDEFPSFEAWFFAMLDLNRREVEALQRDPRTLAKIAGLPPLT